MDKDLIELKIKCIEIVHPFATSARDLELKAKALLSWVLKKQAS